MANAPYLECTVHDQHQSNPGWQAACVRSGLCVQDRFDPAAGEPVRGQPGCRLGRLAILSGQQPAGFPGRSVDDRDPGADSRLYSVGLRQRITRPPKTFGFWWDFESHQSQVLLARVHVPRAGRAGAQQVVQTRVGPRFALNSIQLDGWQTAASNPSCYCNTAELACDTCPGEKRT